MTEQTIEREMVRKILNTPHGDLVKNLPEFMRYKDAIPWFTAHFASWYLDNGKVRDHNVLFATALVFSDFREVACALIQNMSPRDILRTVELINWYKTGKSGGHFYDVPRSVKGAIKYYLKARFDQEDWFFSAVASNRDSLKRLIRGLRLPHPKYVQETLFESNYVEGSLPWVIREISISQDEDRTIDLLLNNNVPWPIAISIAKNTTPAIMAAMVSKMTPVQTFNHLKLLKSKGFLDNPQLKAMIFEKMQQGENDKKFISARAKRALDVSEIDDEELLEVADNVMTKSIQKQYVIKRDTAIIIDASGSMESSLALGKNIVANVAAVIDKYAKLYTYTFSNYANEFVVDGERTILDVEKALWGVRASGETSYGAPIDSMNHKDQIVEQFVFIGDDQENASPRFSDAYRRYVQKFNIFPSVIFVKVGGSRFSGNVEAECVGSGIPMNMIKFTDGDDYSVGHILALMSAPSESELLETIARYPLVKRRWGFTDE